MKTKIPATVETIKAPNATKTRKTREIAIEKLDDAALASLAKRIREEQARRVASVAPPLLAYASLYAGNPKAGSRHWIKRITAIDPAKGNGYGILGDFEKFGQLAVKEGEFFLACGAGGSHKNSTKNYFLLRAKADAEPIELERGYQKLTTKRFETVAEDCTLNSTQANEVLARHPDLAPSVPTGLLPIFVALREAGF